MNSEQNVLLEVRGVSKSFPGVKALKDISLDFRKGEVHAVCGENGAGKSTLIKILTGIYSMDSGTYQIDGKDVRLRNAQEAIDRGIACVYQELSIVPLLDIANNLYLGHLPVTKGGVWDKKTMYKQSRELLDKIGLEIDPKTPAGNVSIAHQQMIEIGRALTRNARCIIMDEPTSSLTDNEIATLFEFIAKLKADGITVVFISHKLEEVLQISDRITVIRDGEKIITYDAADSTRDELIKHMVGRELKDFFYKRKATPGEPVLQIENLSSKGVFQDVSFTVRAGEILGFFGLMGAGRSEIMRAVFGVDKYDEGTIRIGGQPVKIHSPKGAMEMGIGLIPEDRRLEGLAVKLSVFFNMTIVKLGQISRLGFINKKRQRAAAQEFQDKIAIKTPSLSQRVEKLSGGNQQKVVLSKWLMVNPKILILDEPTRGVDIGAKAEIYKLIGDLAMQGVAIIMVSSEMPELLGLCDRVAAVCEGKLIDCFDIETATPERILSAAIGGGAS